MQPSQIDRRGVSQRVSVVIPTRDRRSSVLRAIRSVVGQSLRVTEIIVVDDGSMDGTPAAVRDAFPGVVLIEQETTGVSGARNSGIAVARGDWIAFLDSDDEWLPQKMERQLQTLAAAPDVRLCHSNEIWIRNGRRVNPRRRHEKAGGWIFRRCLSLCCISPSAAVIRRDVFDDVGLFDESLPACEDYDLWLRICSREPVAYVDEPLILKRGGHDDQLSRRFWGMDRFRIKALEQVLLSQRLAQDDRVAALEALCDKIKVYLAGAEKRDKHDEAGVYRDKLVRARFQLEQIQGAGVRDESRPKAAMSSPSHVGCEADPGK